MFFVANRYAKETVIDLLRLVTISMDTQGQDKHSYGLVHQHNFYMV